MPILKLKSLKCIRNIAEIFAKRKTFSLSLTTTPFNVKSPLFYDLYHSSHVLNHGKEKIETHHAESISNSGKKWNLIYATYNAMKNAQ